MRRIAKFFWPTMLALLGACGGGGGSSTAEPLSVGNDQSGQIVIAITDAEGDFTRYEVDVTSIELERADGSVVETLPLTTRVDFAELTEVSEFLTIATVPVGRYLSATLRLDFSDANVVVQDEHGVLHEAVLHDGAGDPVGALDVMLQLADADAIVIRPGAPAAFSLDFDLDASNSIDLSATPPVVVVEPFLLATAELEADREHRLRGLLHGVDQSVGEITVGVRPLRQRRGGFGELTFSTTSDTFYEIDGVGLEGDQGFAALAELQESVPEIPLVAGGLISEHSLVAATVLAGSSVPWTTHDVVRGAVVARADKVLTLSGVIIEYSDGVVARRGQLDVQLGEGTAVTALGLNNDSLSEASISVGQRVVAFGELTEDETLDASDDHVRMQVSQLTADVLEDEALALDLYYLNGRRPGAFDFSGTGIDVDNDAEPDFYQVDTDRLALSSVQSGDLVRVRGHVNSFGAAPDDFIALSVVDLALDARSASFGSAWPEPGDPTTGISSDRIGLGLLQARALLKLKGVPLGETNPLETLSLVAPDDGSGVYAVLVREGQARVRPEIHLYRSFADLGDAILAQLQAGHGLRFVSAHGRYDVSAGELTSPRASFEFIELN